MTAGRPSVSVPVLSKSDACRRARAAAAPRRCAISTPAARAAADADHDRHRRRQAQRARTGDDQHRDRRAERVGQPRLWTDHHPRRRGRPARRRSPPARTSRRPGRPAAGSARGCAAPRRPSARSARPACRRRPSRPASTKPPLQVDRAADHLVARPLGDRHRLAGEQRLVDLALAARHLAVDRDRLAGPHAQRIADADGDRARRPRRRPSAMTRRAVFGASASRRADRPAGALARPQLQHLAEQRQHHDHRGGLEVERRRPRRRAPRPGRGQAPRAAATLAT